MFEPVQPTTPPSSGGPFAPPPQPSPFTPDPASAPAPAASDPSVMRTMPSRFLPGEPGAPKKSRAWVVVVIVAASVLVVGAAAYLLLSGQILGPANANANLNTNAVNAAGNRNLTTNAGSNLNAIANTNASNTNASANANANTNASNTNASANANANTNATTATTTGSPLPSSADADSDGLTDVEESLYGSDPVKADTDGDSFVDGMRIQADGTLAGEVALGYDPTAAGRKLDAAGLVRTYENTTGGYAVLYPSRWVVQPDSAGTGATFVSDVATGEFFQASVTDNPGNLTAKQWYQNLNPGTDLSAQSSFLVNGLDAFQSLDDATVFYARGGKVYTLTYNTDGLTAVNYRATFTMALRSFRLLLADANTNG